MSKIISVSCLLLCLSAASCTKIGVRVLSKRAELPADRIMQDVVYVENGDPRQRLDLYLPDGKNWPVLVFVHGGGWNTGDKALRVGGLDVYGNIGRFFAAQGIGTAVINYRLLPMVTWREQTDDVDAAFRWVRANIQKFSGNPHRVFLGGHSAGAHLAAHAALDAEPDVVTGVILISAAGLDLNDRETYRLGAKEAYYELRFLEDGDWRTAASPAAQVTAEAPPFLIFYAAGESKALQHQAKNFYSILHRHGVETTLVEVPGESHQRIVLTASHPDKILTKEALRFIKDLAKP